MQNPEALNQVYNVAVDGTTLNELYAELPRLLAPGRPHLEHAKPIHRECMPETCDTAWRIWAMQ
jgi:hypothetical protein